MVLNELKRTETELEAEIQTQLPRNDAEADEADKGSTTTSKQMKLSKINIVAKALFLDVILDYIMLVLKDRKHKRRWILILYLLISLASHLWPYHKGLSIYRKMNFKP